MIWQLFMALLVAASALAIGVFSSRLATWVTNDRATVQWSGAIAAATWIATPWDLGVTAWPTTFAAQLSVIGFCALGYVTISNAPLKSKLAKGGVVLSPRFANIRIILAIVYSLAPDFLRRRGQGPEQPSKMARDDNFVVRVLCRPAFSSWPKSYRCSHEPCNKPNLPL